MTRIVCQVSDKPGRITLVWSAGGASFEPIHIEDGELSELRTVASSVHQRLAAGSDPNELGRRLFALLFPGTLGGEIAGWLRDVDGRGELESLEVASDAPGEIPWTALDDPQRPGAWGRRLNMSGGHRVHPLRSYPDLVEPTLIALLHPALDPAVAAELTTSLAARQASIVRTREELMKQLETQLPDILWIVAPASDVGWRLEPADLRADELARAFARGVPGNPSPLVVSSAFGESNVAAVRESIPGLVASETPIAEGPALALGRAFLDAFAGARKPLGAALRQVREKIAGPASLAWTGYAPPQVGVRTADDVSAAPTPTIHPLPAEPFHPLRPLEREDRALLLGREADILACGETLDRADASALWIHGKASVGKASLLRAGLVPFLEEETGGFLAWRDRSEVEGAESEANQPTISGRVGRDLAGTVALGLLAFCAKPLQFKTPTGRTVTVDLPALLGDCAPVLSTAFREGADPAPLPGTETARAAEEPRTIVRDALRPLSERISADSAVLDRILERITRPLPFELVLAFEQGEDMVALPQSDRVEEDPQATKGAYRSKAKRDLTIGGISFVAGVLITLSTFASALASGGRFFLMWGLIVVGLGELIRGLFYLVLSARHDRPVLTHPVDNDRSEVGDAAERRTVAGRVLDVLGRTSARCKTVVTVRTEYFAQVQDVMHDISARQAWEDFYVRELDEDMLRDVLIAPTLTEPLPYSNQPSAAKYGFGYDPKVVDDILAQVRWAAISRQHSRLSLLQTAGARLYGLMQSRSTPQVRAADLKRLKVEQAMSDLVREKSRSVVRGSSRRVRNLLERLIVRHDNGIRTRNLISLHSLEKDWNDSKPLEPIVNGLYKAGIVDLQRMAQDGDETLYVGAPQDSFATADVDPVFDALRRSYARSKVVDTLFIMIPLAALGMALAYWFVKDQYSKYISPEQFSSVRKQIDIIDVGMKTTQLSAYHGQIGRAEAALERGDTLRARQLLLSGVPDPDDPDLRGFEWYLLSKKSQMEAKNLFGHTAGVRALALAGSDEVLASGDELGKVNLWNLKKEGELGASLVGLKRPALSLTFSADGAWVAGCDGDREVLVWPTTLGDERPVETEAKTRIDLRNVRAVAFVSPGVLAAASNEGVILWDVAAGKEKAKLKDLAAPPLAIVALEDGKFAAASADQAIVWSGDGKKESAVKLKGATIHAIAAAKSGLLIAGASDGPTADGVVYVWDLKDGSTPARKARQPGAVRAVASLGGDRIATGGDDMTIRIHDLASGAQIGRLYGHLSRVRSLAADKRGRLVSASFDPVIKTWSTGADSSIRESVPAHDSVQALALDPTGQVLASGGHDGLIKLWGILTTQMTGEIKAGAPVVALAFDRGGPDKSVTLAAAVGNDVLRWSLTAGKTGFDVKELPPLKKHTDRVLCLHFSPDGKQLASGSRDKSAIFWDIATQKPKHVFATTASITAIDCPAPLVIAGDENGWLRIWDTETGRPFEPFQAHGLAVTGIDVMNQPVISGGFLSTSLDQTLRHSGRTPEHEGFDVISTVRGFAEPVTAFVQGPGFVALGGEGGSLAIVDVSIDEPRLVLRAHKGRVNAAVLTRELGVLVTGGADGRIRFFRADPRPEYGPVRYRLFPRRPQQPQRQAPPDDD